jgi:3-hydroxyacyl-[acyl-carrier-protein] dehydratase
MRYILIDRIVSLEPGRSLRAFKLVSATDGFAAAYGDGMPALPASMLMEAMAQAAGLLAVRSVDTPSQPVLAKVQPFTARALARAGDRVDLEAVLDDLRPEGCRAAVTASVDGRVIATATIFLGFVPIEDAATETLLADRLAVLFPGWFDEPAHVESAS